MSAPGSRFSSGEVTTLAAMNAALLVAVNTLSQLDEFEGRLSLGGGLGVCRAAGPPTHPGASTPRRSSSSTIKFLTRTRTALY